MIEDAIKTCKVVVLVFSQSASISKWVKGEINVAFTEDKPILPFRVDETEIKGGFRVMLNQMHWIDAFPKYSDRLPDLLNSVGGFLGRQPHKVSGNDERLEAERRAAEAAERERLEQERRKKEDAERKAREAAERKRQALQNIPVSSTPHGDTHAPKKKKTLWIALAAVAVATLVAIMLFNASTKVVVEQPVNGGDLTITANGVSYEMKPVEGGTFQMGSNDSEAWDNEQPVHSVTVSTFYMGETEVTQALWKAVMGSNPSTWKGDNLPVEAVSWNDCQKFIRKLNSLTGRSFRLPTEAEWEFAARGGNQSNGYKYAGSNSIGSVAWYDDNSGSKTHSVKGKSPNELGLYDMSGNVWEWCSDWYGDYDSGSLTNPKGPSSGSSRVLRGCSWLGSARACRVSRRSGGGPDFRDYGYGFRLCLPQ